MKKILLGFALIFLLVLVFGTQPSKKVQAAGEFRQVSLTGMGGTPFHWMASSLLPDDGGGVCVGTWRPVLDGLGMYDPNANSGGASLICDSPPDPAFNSNAAFGADKTHLRPDLHDTITSRKKISNREYVAMASYYHGSVNSTDPGPFYSTGLYVSGLNNYYDMTPREFYQVRAHEGSPYKGFRITDMLEFGDSVYIVMHAERNADNFMQGARIYRHAKFTDDDLEPAYKREASRERWDLVYQTNNNIRAFLVYEGKIVYVENTGTVRYTSDGTNWSNAESVSIPLTEYSNKGFDYFFNHTYPWQFPYSSYRGHLFIFNQQYDKDMNSVSNIRWGSDDGSFYTCPNRPDCGGVVVAQDAGSVEGVGEGIFQLISDGSIWLWKPVTNAGGAFSSLDHGGNSVARLPYDGINYRGTRYPKDILINNDSLYVTASNTRHLRGWHKNGRPAYRGTVWCICAEGSSIGAPTVTLQADPTAVTSGESSMLKWTSQNADTLEIDNGIGSVSVPLGEKEVSPTENTTYTITAKKGSESATASATVSVSIAPHLVLDLPPKEIATPRELRVAGNAFTFSPSSGQFSPAESGGYRVETTQLGSDREQFYRIKIFGFQKGSGGIAVLPKEGKFSLSSILQSVTTNAYYPPPAVHLCRFLVCGDSGGGGYVPAGFKLTLAGPLSKNRVSDFSAYLASSGRPMPELAYVSDKDCASRQNGGEYLCIRTKTTFISPERSSTGPLFTLSSMKIGSLVSVAGNVAGVEIGPFAIQPNAIAVGDSVTVQGGRTLDNYFSSSALKWGNGSDGLIGQKMEEVYAKRERGSTVADTDLGRVGSDGAFPGDAAPCSSWNLNSSNSKDPCSSAQTSFSSPPEGKLWNITKGNGATGTFTLGNGSALSFSGAGTLVFGGDVIVNAPITCAPGTRLAILTKGDIIFRNSQISCGAYVAMGGSSYYSRDGDIRLDDPPSFTASSGDLMMILVAKRNVVLPRIQGLTGSYKVRYDSDFAQNPTILFREILSLIRGNSG